MIANDNINYLRKFIMLYGKEDLILIHNLHVLKGYDAKKMKRGSERRKHCALVVVRQSQKFSTHRRHPSRGRRTAKI